MDVDDSLNMHFSAEADVSDLDPEGNQPLCQLLGNYKIIFDANVLAVVRK